MHQLALLFTLASTPLLAQQATFNFVSPTTLGKVTLPPTGGAWQPAEAALYDGGTRPVLGYRDQSRNIVLSVLIFPNHGKPNAEDCRDSLIPGLTSMLREHSALLTEEATSSRRAKSGVPLALASYNIAKQGTLPLDQRNIFAFAGDANTCVELHLSKVEAKPADQKALAEIVDQFDFDLAYKPAAADYETMGVIYFRGAKNFGAAAIYYQRAYDQLTPNERKSRMGRYAADQLTIAYGMSGDIRRARSTAEQAIATDPDYPLYYYNLACADAENTDAASARTHLEQAFARRANMLEGEKFPDPTQDDSLQKLKEDKPFWALATRISGELKK